MNLGLIADSGQCFRMQQQGHQAWELIAHGRLLTITREAGDIYCFDCSQADFDGIWHHYFDLDRDYEQLLTSIPGEDHFLQAAAQQGRGLRILRQEPFETIISFIISQRKTIPAIRRAVALLAQRFGSQIAPGRYAFPQAAQLAAQPLEALQACGLGYRSPYVLHTARLIAAGQPALDTLACLDDQSLMAALCQLPGVGKKVAGCAMLFAFARLDAFPRDVWINRVIAEVYGGHFPLDPFVGHGGFIQQLMFCYGRSPEYRKLQEQKG